MKKNENHLDRLVRLIFAEIFSLVGFFWTSGILQIVFFVLAGIMLVTAIIGFCPLYVVLKINTSKYTGSKKLSIGMIVLIVVLGLGGTYGSMFFSKKIFLEDFATMNDSYKQLLFNTGKDKRPESISYYEKLLPAYALFQKKYTGYKPYILRKDLAFDTDLERIALLLNNVKDAVYSGDLPATHKKLEEVRPMFQDIFKRNGFSLLAVTLVDFHDIMEEIIAGADTKDAQKIINTYPLADEKLKEVEQELNDESIQTIRSRLDAIYTAAENNQLDDLAKQGADLKSSFIKVYLIKG